MRRETRLANSSSVCLGPQSCGPDKRAGAGQARDRAILGNPAN